LSKKFVKKFVKKLHHRYTYLKEAQESIIEEKGQKSDKNKDKQIQHGSKKFCLSAGGQQA
jgi:hypothetical protein